MKDIQGLVYHCFKNFKIRVIYNFFDDIRKKGRLKLVKKYIGLKFLYFLISYILIKKNLRLSSVF
jgi:hypothetical protein